MEYESCGKDKISEDAEKRPFYCHPGCAACCIAPSISSAIPGMSTGKPAGIRCIQLTEENRCRLFGLAGRPAVCGSLQPSEQMCGASYAEAMDLLTELEHNTLP